MGHRLAFLLLLVALLPGLAAQETASSPDALYLQDRGGASDTYNFTTEPPDTNATGARLQLISTGLEARMSWWMDNLPGAWTLSGDASGLATVFLSGLDEVAPLPNDPATVPETRPGEIRIEALVLDIEEQVIMRGTAAFAPQPHAPRAEVFRFDIDLEPVVAATFDPEAADQAMLFRLIVTGRNITLQNISPVHAHIGSVDVPAAVRLPGFPYAAFRAWEEADEAEADCNERRLRGESCTPEGGPGEDEDDAQPVPAVWWFAAPVAAFVWLARLRPGNGRR